MEITAEKRTVFGKATADLRQQGLIPAELYGRGVENIHLALPQSAFGKLFREAGSSTVIALTVDGQKHSVLIHDVSRNYLRGEIDHVDFYQVQAGQKIRTRVPLVLTGESPVIKTGGAVLNTAMVEIEVEATAEHLPHELSISLETLTEIGQSLHVKDLVVPKGVTLHVDPETVIASVAEQRAEEIVVPAATVDVAEVKVESEEKKADRAEKKEGEDKK